jgi:hypothetical protein
MESRTRSLWHLRKDSVWAAMIITVLLLWGAFVAIGKAKRQNEAIKEALAEFKNRQTNTQSAEFERLSGELDSLREEIQRLRGLMWGATSKNQRAIEAIQASHEGSKLPMQPLQVDDSNEGVNDRDLMQQRLEAMEREQNEFVGSLDGTGLIELDERTNELVEAGLQKALQGVPEDVRPEILKLMESDRERIHETMKQAAIQQMMSEAQNREILDSLNLERHNERE